MAIVKGPALSIEASGNLGAICYSKWRNLQIAKGVWTGSQPNTVKQVTQQGNLTSVSQAWGGTLTSAERQTWHNLAPSIVWRDRLGNSYIPSGYQLFMKWNIRRKVMNLAIMNIAPAVQERPIVFELDFAVYIAIPRIVVALLKNQTEHVDGFGVEFYRAGPFDSGGRSPIEGEWRFKSRKVPPATFADNDVLGLKWYWYRGRTITEFGDVGNYFQIQVELA